MNAATTAAAAGGTLKSLNRRKFAQSLLDSILRNSTSSQALSLLLIQPAYLMHNSVIPARDLRINARLVHNWLQVDKAARHIEPHLALHVQIDSKGCYSEKIYRKSQSHQDLIWNGQNTSRKLLEQMTEVSNVEYFDSIETIIDSVTQNSGSILNCDNESFEIIKPYCSDKIIVKDITHHFNSIEITKNPNLIENFRKSVTIASNALIKCMEKSTEEFTNEIELDEEFAYQCSKSGAECLAYPPVVASGSNSTAIHYLRKTDKMVDGDLILMDAGCRFAGACSDLTRTWPKNKKFTDKQACVYQIVLDAQKLCFEMLSSSKDVTLKQLMIGTLYLIGKQMCERNIVKKSAYSFKELVQIGQRYCPHHIGHHIGNYLHDCHKIVGSDDIVLGNNMCFTIEPGIYIQKDDEQVNPEFRGIGIRIEDCCLINENGEFEVLSKNVPREIIDIEQLLS